MSGRSCSPDPTERFSSRAQEYARARPGYPGLVELLEREIGLGPNRVIADIGSGTGLSARPFLSRGYAVIGVEPNVDMRAAAERLLRGQDRFRSVAGTGERTGLESGSVDCVLVAQAFHWLDPEQARREFARILRPPGWVVIAWNKRHTEGSAFLRGYEALLREFGTDYATVGHRTVVGTGDAATGRSELRSFFRGPYRRRVLANAQALDLEGLRSRLVSASYTPAPGSDRYASMSKALEALHRDHAEAGVVRITYDLEVFFGTLTG